MESHTPQPVRFSIRGLFQVTNSVGADITPRGRKSQGILALLLTSKELRRSRGFLKDKLWSDRGPDQAAASLRFGLTEIRKAFGEERFVIGSDRHAVWLEPKHCQIDRGENHSGMTEDLFEGLDIRDPEFDTWLTSLRANDVTSVDPPAEDLSAPRILKVPRLPTPRRDLVVFHFASDTHARLSLVENILGDLVARSLHEQTEADIFLQNIPETDADGLLIGVQAFECVTKDQSETKTGLRVSIESLGEGRFIWSEMCLLGPDAEIVAEFGLLHTAAARIVNAVLGALGRLRRVQGDTQGGSNLRALIGLQKAFAIRPNEAEQAEKLLLEAFSIAPRGVYLAWLVQLHVIEFVERLRPLDDVIEKALERASQALKLEPENSHVLVANANARLVFERDTGLARMLSQQAITANPCNAMAWCTLGQIQLYTGEIEAALVSSSRAQALAKGSSLQFWMDFQKALACAMAGQLAEATVLARMSALLRPEFHAALRYSIAFHTAADKLHHAKEAAANLQKLEHDFTPSRMADDPEYPIGLMRSTAFYMPERFRELQI